MKSRDSVDVEMQTHFSNCSIAITGLGHVGKKLARSLEDRFQLVLSDQINANPYPGNEISECEIDCFCVGTPMNDDGSCDISQVEFAVMRSTADLIVSKSTVTPGTTDQLVALTGKKLFFHPNILVKAITQVIIGNTRGKLDSQFSVAIRKCARKLRKF